MDSGLFNTAPSFDNRTIPHSCSFRDVFFPFLTFFRSLTLPSFKITTLQTISHMSCFAMKILHWHAPQYTAFSIFGLGKSISNTNNSLGSGQILFGPLYRIILMLTQTETLSVLTQRSTRFAF